MDLAQGVWVSLRAGEGDNQGARARSGTRGDLCTTMIPGTQPLAAKGCRESWRVGP